LRDQLVIEYYKDSSVRDYMTERFGSETLEHLDKMFAIKLPRKILGD
jgi:hypothetical protein